MHPCSREAALEGAHSLVVRRLALPVGLLLLGNGGLSARFLFIRLALSPSAPHGAYGRTDGCAPASVPCNSTDQSSTCRASRRTSQATTLTLLRLCCSLLRSRALISGTGRLWG